MKHVFLFGVLLFSLLAVCNCKNELSPSYVTEHQRGEVEKGENPGNNPGQTDNNEPEMPEVIPPEIVPPEAVPPEVVQPEEGTQGGETEENKDEKNETKEGEDKEDEEGGDEEILPPEIEKLDFAVLQINELRPEIAYVGDSTEYIEFKVIKGGGMEGLYLSIMINAQETFVYIFPPIDVETGEYITLHLRELDKYKCFDELREDELSLSGGVDSCPTARDLWVTGNNKLLNKTGIVYLQDEYGRIMDAIVMIEKPGTAWNSNQAHFAGIMERFFKCGMWQAANGNKPTPLDAVDTSAIGKNYYKSVSRYEGRENTHSAKDWFVAGYITPGKANN
jgi:hypothetical protein